MVGVGELAEGWVRAGVQAEVQAGRRARAGVQAGRRARARVQAGRRVQQHTRSRRARLVEDRPVHGRRSRGLGTGIPKHFF